ncbi:exocyst complex component EXO70I-like [Bidens hawaiensis]|uniref:exocyst complex component EXO70I-like n=1 Tax=Bidens hawaiensis TaxID=980011 RepID=UPI00404A9BF5
MEHMRDLLNSTLHQSREIDFEIHKTSVNLARINRTFPSLETAVRNMASQCATLAIRDHVHRALPPVSAVLNVHQLVNELGTSLADSAHSSSHLTIYISRIKRFRQALTLLTNTCKLAIKWLQDLQHTTDHFNVCKTLHLLEELQETEKRCLLDGILGVAFRVLQDEFQDLLTQNSFPIEVPSSLFSSGDEESDPLPKPVLPLRVVENLKAIMACYSACGNQNQVDRCMSIYVKVRITTVETSLKGLELDYLEMSLSEFDSVQDIEGYIDEWGRHLEFVVKHLLELEYTLCHQVFGQQTADCFSKIALRSGIQRFIKFGNTITKAKKEAIKLFKLLDVFAALDNLRQDFNKFFGGKQCSEIQTQTRDLIKKVVNGASEIFHELPAQVQFQRLTDPPPDGSVPRLVPFVVEYSEELLDDDYQSVLDQVLKIHCSWYNTSKVVVSVEIHNIVKSLEVNLDTWAKRYEDTALCCIFIMNTSWYLSKHVKGTRLGDLMGESWLKRHEDRVEYYTKLYLRESWGKILVNNDEIEGFTEAFDEEYKKQSGWVLCDNSLRWKTGRLIAGMIVPVYKRLVEGGGGSKKHVKYSSERIESVVTSMLQPKDKDAKLIDRIKSVFSPTAAASS